MAETTRDALNIIDREILQNDPELALQVEKERVHALAAQIVYDLRTTNGLSQRELAARVGTSASAICRLEDSNYGSHTLNMLIRIVSTFGYQIRLEAVPLDPSVAGAPGNAAPAPGRLAGP